MKGGGRAVAVDAVTRVLRDGRSLSAALQSAVVALEDTRERGLARELAYGVFRWLPRLEAVLGALLSRPLKSRDADVRAVLLLGLYQLMFTRIPAHAAVAESVALTRQLGKPWSSGLVNAVLRRFQREADALLERADRRPEARLAHPGWLIEAIRRAWPADFGNILDAGNGRAPMTLRVNARRHTRDHYLELLRRRGLDAAPTPHCPQGLTLTAPVDVERLPEFERGAVSVQDGAAQLAAPLLAPRPGQRVLDACAAPGGKSAHLLELEPDLGALVAVDSDAGRIGRLTDTLARLGLGASVIHGDAGRPGDWWDGQPFDRILLDVPCSATGIIRRRPDIKFHRRESDLNELARIQRSLLEALWPLLARAGLVLYATCSILPQENQQQVAEFVKSRSDAALCPMESNWGRRLSPGRQILPGEDGMDGFYYALLAKR